jgi:hypothetical protein
MESTKCPISLNGVPCGLDAYPVPTEEAKATGLHMCGLGHRFYVMESMPQVESKESAKTK